MTDHEFKAPKRTTTEPSDETTARLAEIRDRANAAAPPDGHMAAKGLTAVADGQTGPGRNTKAPAYAKALCVGAGDEIRTHDPNLGKVMLYP